MSDELEAGPSPGGGKNNNRSKQSLDFFENEIQTILQADIVDSISEINYRLQRRGRVLILNYVDFQNSPRRQGSEADVENLKELFSYLKFPSYKVIIYNNLCLKETETVLNEESLRNHSNEDCLIVFILSHGDGDGFYCRDTLYPYDRLFDKFSGDRCPTLLSKPKLFFFQCCRGERFDPGVGLACDGATESRQSIRLPLTSDIFAFYATFKDFYAWRNPHTGSWFVQELVKIFKLHGGSHDLLTLATLTCREIAFHRESRVAGDFLRNRKKQMPTFMSTLTKRLFFFEANQS